MASHIDDGIPKRRVKILSTTLVKPKVASPPHTSIPLSNLDRIFGYYYTPLILYYPLQPTSVPAANGDYIDDQIIVRSCSSFFEITGRLKESLSQVLVMFYPLAGRVIRPPANEKNGDALEMDTAQPSREMIKCNDEGAIFIEACIEARLEDLRMHDSNEEYIYSPAPQLSGVAAGTDSGSISSSHDLPLLVVQATQFLCGGLAVAINWLHKVADGVSGFAFVKAWAECSRNSADFDLISHKYRPVFDRTSLNPRSPPQPKVDVYHTVRLRDPHSGELQAAHNQQLLCKRWLQVFSFKALQKLKQEATRDESMGQLTTYECLSAHLWRCLTRARGLPSDAITKFGAVMDGRKRLRTPAGYFGNVVMGQSECAVRVEELLGKPLSFAAGLIRNSILSTTDEAFRSLIDWVELQSPSSHIQFGGSQFNSGSSDLALASWAGFGLYEMDFCFGPPGFAVRNGLSSPAMNGRWFLFPSPAGKHDKIVLMNLQPHILASLLADPEFYVLQNLEDPSSF